MKRLPIALFICVQLPFAISAFADEGYNPTQDLLAAFGGRCSSSGALTDMAMSQSTALSAVITQLKNDSACSSIVPLVNSLDVDIQSQLQMRQAQDTHYQDNTAVVNDLTAALQTELALGAAADPAYVAQLKSELNQQRVELLKSKQNITYYSKSRRQHDIVMSFYKNAGLLMDSLSANSACMSNHTNILARVGAQVVQFASLFAAQTMTGTLAFAVGGVLDHFIQYVRTDASGKVLRDVNMAQLKIAVGCSLEGMAATYCQARDASLIINVNSTLPIVDTCSSIAQGTGLLSNDMPAFADFVSAIYAGSPASSAAAAQEKNTATKLRSDLDALRINLQGNCATFKKELNGITDPVAQVTKRKSMISALVQKITEAQNEPAYNRTGPIGDIFIDDKKCGAMAFYYSKGKDRRCNWDSSDGGDCMNCIARNYKETPSYGEIETTTNDLLAGAAQGVNDQVQLYLQNNAQLALTQSEVIGKYRRKGRDFLDDALVYLDHVLSEPDGIAKGQMKKTIENARKTVKAAIDALDHPVPAGQPESPVQTAAKLSEILAPGSDIYAVPREITTIVRQDIDDRIEKGKVDQNLAAILQLSASDSVQELISHSKGLDAVKTQIRAAKSITRTNLEALGLTFGEQLKELMGKMEADSKSNPDVLDDIALLCSQVLLLPSAPRTKDFDATKYCQGKKYKSVYPDLVLDFDTLSRRPFEDRVCSVYDFYRKSQLIENRKRFTGR